jgi:hypothetical protein
MAVLEDVDWPVVLAWVGAAAAIGGALWTGVNARTAKRSAAEAKRSADATQGMYEIALEKRAEELAEREERTVPRLELVNTGAGMSVVVAMQHSQWSATMDVRNAGGTDAVVEAAVFRHAAVRSQSHGRRLPIVVPPDKKFHLAFDAIDVDALRQGLTPYLDIEYGTTSRPRAWRVTFELRRQSGSVADAMSYVVRQTKSVEL